MEANPTADERYRKNAELRGLTASLGPERAALVVRLLALSRAGKADGIWLRKYSVRLRVKAPDGSGDACTATIQWDRLANWLTRIEGNTRA
jgi:hypothetical protein